MRFGRLPSQTAYNNINNETPARIRCFVNGKPEATIREFSLDILQNLENKNLSN